MQDRVGAARGEHQAEVAAALGRVEIVVGNAVIVGQVGGLAAGEAVSLIEERGTHPDGDGEAVRHHDGSEHAGVGRRRR